MIKISLQQLIVAVDAYQAVHWNAKRKSDLSTISEHLKNVQVYERSRGSKQLVLPTVHQIPRVQLTTLLPELGNAISADTSLPDSVLVVSPVPISLEVQQTLTEMMRQEHQVDLRFLGNEEMMSIPEFASILKDDDDGVFDDLDVSHKMLYDMLGEGQNVDDIKNCLVCSVIVFILDEKGKILTDELVKAVQDKLGKDVGSLQQEIRFLQKKGRLKSEKFNKDLLSLTDSEKKNIEVAKEKSLQEEKAFYAEFHALLDKYRICDEHKELFGKLRSMYISRCGVQLDQEISSNIKNDKERVKNAVDDFQQFVKSQIKEPNEMASFMEEMKELCQSNSFLSRVGASESFLSLYRSKKLEKYLGSKHKRVYLDTKVFVYYLCSKSGLLQGQSDWQEHGYRSTVNLMKLRHNKKIDVKFFVRDDYLGEAVGELKKALRTSWFTEMRKFPIPYETSNTFYNYYHFLHDEGRLNDSIHNFEDFVRSLGFELTDPEHHDFEKSSMNKLLERLQYLGIERGNNKSIAEALFKEMLKEYEMQLMSKGKEKTKAARMADVRQTAILCKDSNVKDADFYFCSWDYTTIDLRDWLINKSPADYKHYSIYNPSRLANKFSLTDFNITSKSITDELFFYADNHYRISEKIRMLYDDVIVPLFGYIKRDDMQALNFILGLQKTYLSQHKPEMTDLEIDKKLPLEIIFNGISQKAYDEKYSTQELSNFLNDVKNLEYLKNFFTDAFNDIKNDRKVDELIAGFSKRMDAYFRENGSKDVDIPVWH